MNRDVRKKELLKITIENQAILRRLQDKTSNYSVHRWEEDFRHKEKIMRNMCEYPFILDGDPNKTNISDGNITAYNSESRLHQFQLPRIGTSTSSKRNPNKSFSTAGGVNDSLLAGKGSRPLIR